MWEIRTDMCFLAEVDCSKKEEFSTEFARTFWALSPFLGGRGARILECDAIPFSRRSSRPRNWTQVSCTVGRCFPGGSDGKSGCLQCGRPGFDPWIGKIPWRRKWQPTPVLLPGKSVDGGAWWTAVHGVAKSHTQLGDFTFTFWAFTFFHFHFLSFSMSASLSALGYCVKCHLKLGIIRGSDYWGLLYAKPLALYFSVLSVASFIGSLFSSMLYLKLSSWCSKVPRKKWLFL